MCSPMATRWSCDARDSRRQFTPLSGTQASDLEDPAILGGQSRSWRAVGAAVQFPEAPLPWPGSVQTSAAAQAVAPAGFADAWWAAPLMDLLPLSQPQSPRVSSLVSLRALNVAQLHGRRNCPFLLETQLSTFRYDKLVADR